MPVVPTIGRFACFPNLASSTTILRDRNYCFYPALWFFYAQLDIFSGAGMNSNNFPLGKLFWKFVPVTKCPEQDFCFWYECTISYRFLEDVLELVLRCSHGDLSHGLSLLNKQNR